MLTPYVIHYYDATQNVSSRLITWRYAMDIWLSHPEWIPFGSGFGAFQQRLLVGGGSTPALTLTALHSGYLQVLLELGVSGACLLAWFLITTARPHLARRGTEWQVAVLGAVIAFLASQVVDNALFAVTGTCAFALIACLRRTDAMDSRQSKPANAPSARQSQEPFDVPRHV